MSCEDVCVDSVSPVVIDHVEGRPKSRHNVLAQAAAAHSKNYYDGDQFGDDDEFDDDADDEYDLASSKGLPIKPR